MKCQKCKTEIKGKLKFCPQCGAPVKAKIKKTLFWTPGDENIPDFKNKAKASGVSKPSSSKSPSFPVSGTPGNSISPSPPSGSPPPPAPSSSNSLPSPPPPGVPATSSSQSNSTPMDSSLPLDMNNLNFPNSASNSYQGKPSPPIQSSDHGAINFKNVSASDNSQKKIVYVIIGVIWLLAIAGLIYYFVK